VRNALGALSLFVVFPYSEAVDFAAILPRMGFPDPSQFVLLRRNGGEAHFVRALILQTGWCGRWELNPHGPCSPADFLTGHGFRRPDKQVCGLDYPFTLLLNNGG